MKFNVIATRPQEYSGDTLIIPAAKLDKIKSSILKEIDMASDGVVTTLLGSEEFSGKENEISVIYHPAGFKCSRLMLVGLGETKKLLPDSFRKALGNLSRHKGLRGSTKAAVYMGDCEEDANYQAAVEGYLLGSYKMLDYKTKESDKKVSKLGELTFITTRKVLVAKLADDVTRGAIIAEGQLLARRFAETPPNDLTPRIYAERAKKLALEHKISCQILDEKVIAKERMGGLLGVAQGSVEPPRFIILQYKGGAATAKPIVLVGKGVTFDTGGISIKPALDMHEMKQDMAGSAVMLATILTASRLKLPLNIVTLIPTTENMPSGTAIKPGDILKMRNGKTVEIINTDAEGRLILADALDYANTFNPQAVIDIATLTGAARFILGFAGAPIMGNNKLLIESLERAADITAERVWELPIWEDYLEQMKSSIADLVNSGPPVAGTLAAAAFLQEFIGDWPWAHIDIAYVDMEKKGRPYTPKGATGFGVRLLVEVLSGWKKG
ncbi:MAG: leucyl aminopeptidase [candidate division Zixibacteria bacterium]|nr:leucyl aminopeptidase [candidate division Zixibacteria bacterium]